MVKFSKELEAQLIPEWKEAFVNYRLLKKHVKKIKILRNSRPHGHDHHSRTFDLSFPSFISNLFPSSFSEHQKHRATEKGLQDSMQEENNDHDEESANKNELLHLFSEEDLKKVFFNMLDDELEKVEKFYKRKEKQFTERGELLKNQLEILLDIKQFSIKQRKRNKPVPLTGTLPCSSSSSTLNSDFSENNDDDFSATTSPPPCDGVADARRKGKANTSVKIVIPATNPTRTITAVIKMLWEDLVNNPKKDGSGDSINKKKIENAEKMIRGAFVELYRGLGLLKTYSSLNMVAFRKIVKKFDKVADQNSSSSFLQMVRRSHFISSDKVLRLMDEVETIFTKHFARDNRKRAMKFLRPQESKDSHVVTFLVGLSTGFFVTLFSAYLILLQISEVLSPSSATAYMETVYPVFSMFALLSLHLFLYGCNLLMWRRKRINYNFIFELHQSKSLNHRDVFLICTSIMATVVAALVVHLILRVNDLYPGKVDAIPGVLLLVFISVLVCPFNTFYRSTRYCFLRIIRNIVWSPLYKVLMVDFFMADQLTSQIPLLRHMESSVCYFIAGNFQTHQFETCKSEKLYRQLAYVISFSPYYWRAMQCARMWFDEYDTNHLANMGKYVSAMVAAGARLTYATNDDHLWLSIVLVTSVVATVYQLYWDFVKDWGLLNRKSENPWLRDDLILKRKRFYYLSIALNLVLRVAWVETVLPFRVGILQSRLVEFSLASLEVIRRGHWNFYRVENEHLNNVGKFRAIKSVPLPFRGTDSDD